MILLYGIFFMTRVIVHVCKICIISQVFKIAFIQYIMFEIHSQILTQHTLPMGNSWVVNLHILQVYTIGLNKN